MLPSALLTASAYAISTDFGAESSRPASLVCTLRTHQSPGEWQHSLPACSLALAARDFHPLDFFKWFPPPSLLVSPPPRFSQRDRSLSGIDFVPREINKLRTEVSLQVIDSSSKICSLRHPPRESAEPRICGPLIHLLKFRAELSAGSLCHAARSYGLSCLRSVSSCVARFVSACCSSAGHSLPAAHAASHRPRL